jgi:hypothetical protein
MVCFQTKNPNLGKFWRALDGKMLIYFMDIWNILRTFGKFLLHFVLILYIFPVLVSCTNKNLATLNDRHVALQQENNFSCKRAFTCVHKRPAAFGLRIEEPFGLRRVAVIVADLPGQRAPLLGL